MTIFQARESFQLTYAMKLRNERQNDQALLRDVLYKDFFGPRANRGGSRDELKANERGGFFYGTKSCTV